MTIFVRRLARQLASSSSIRSASSSSSSSSSSFLGSGDETLGKLLHPTPQPKSSIVTFSKMSLPDDIEGEIQTIRAGYVASESSDERLD